MGNLPFTWGQQLETTANTECALCEASHGEERWPLNMLPVKDGPASD